MGIKGVNDYLNWKAPKHREENEREERNATWLELFYDLIYVAIIIQLSHHLFENLNFHGIRDFTIQFTAIWIVWVNMAYYNNRFESEDSRHRFFTFLKMIPMLAMTQASGNISKGGGIIFVISYLVVRGIILYLWYSAGNADKRLKKYTERQVVGNLISMFLWGISILVPKEYMMILWVGAEIVDLIIPAVTIKVFEQIPKINYPHITERFGLFTIIILGEGIISILRVLSEERAFSGRNLMVAALAFTSIFAIWWIYVENINKRSFRENSFYMYVWWTLHLPLMISIVLYGNSLSKFIEQEDFLYSKERWILFLALGMIIFFIAVIERISRLCCSEKLSCDQIRSISNKKFIRRFVFSSIILVSGYITLKTGNRLLILALPMSLLLNLMDDYYMSTVHRRRADYV